MQTKINLPTKRQRELLAIIRSAIEANGYMPSYRDLMKLMGLSSPATIHKLMQELKKKKLLSKPLPTIKTAKDTIPIIGTIAKQQKLELYAKITLYEIPTTMVHPKTSCYGFIVRDNSFADLAILQNDLLIIDTSATAKQSQLVLITTKESGCQLLAYEKAHAGTMQGMVVHLLRSYF